MKKIKTPYDKGSGAELRYREGYEAALNHVVKIAQGAKWRGGDFQQDFCDDMVRLGVDLGPDPR
jgi:hypothetical protein